MGSDAISIEKPGFDVDDCEFEPAADNGSVLGFVVCDISCGVLGCQTVVE